MGSKWQSGKLQKTFKKLREGPRPAKNKAYAERLQITPFKPQQPSDGIYSLALEWLILCHEYNKTHNADKNMLLKSVISSE